MRPAMERRRAGPPARTPCGNAMLNPQREGKAAVGRRAGCRGNGAVGHVSGCDPAGHVGWSPGMITWVLAPVT